MRALLIGIITLFLITPMANADRKGDVKAFNKAYKEYKSIIKTGKAYKAYKPAIESYELGKKLFKGKPETVATLGLNAAQLIANYNRPDEDDMTLVKEVHALHIKVYGEKSAEMIDMLAITADANLKFRDAQKGQKYYTKAIELADAHWGKDNLITARLRLRAGSKILTKSDASSRKAIQYIKKALKTFNESGAEIEAAMAHFWIGKYNLAMRRWKTAEISLNASIQTLVKTDPSSQVTLSNHAFLIKAYEELGMSDKATEHCRAIGKAAPLKENQEFLPVYMKQAMYPRSARKSGKDGFVHNPVAVDGDERFYEASLDAVKKFRFAPRFVDGKAVETSDVKYKFRFNIAD